MLDVGVNRYAQYRVTYFVVYIFAKFIEMTGVKKVLRRKAYYSVITKFDQIV